MYICPTCNRGFTTEEGVAKHFLTCWKEQHPYHQSKPAPRSENINTQEISQDIADFFAAFQKR